MLSKPRRLWLRAAPVSVLAAVLAAFAPSVARADDTPTCPSSTGDAYAMTAAALTGPTATDLTLTFDVAAGCGAVTVVKHIQIKSFTAVGDVAAVKNVKSADATANAVTLALDRVDRGLRIEADAEVQTGEPPRTYVVRAATTSKLRPDVVVREIKTKTALVGSPVSVQAVLEETNADVGATVHATLSGALGPFGEVDAVVSAGKQVTIRFPEMTPTEAVALHVEVALANAVPAEYDATNDTLAGVLEVTKNRLTDPAFVLFPSLVGYGAQFNNHLYAPITQKVMPPGGTADVEQKVKALEPQLVRIFYNDNWEENVDGTHPYPEYVQNYDSFVNVVKLAQDSGATVEISYQNLSNLGKFQRTIPVMMGKYADALEDLVRNHGLTNVRWASVGNEPNNGCGVTLDQYEALYRALDAELTARGLRDQIALMGADLVENPSALGCPERNHWNWFPQMATRLNDVVQGWSEHIYWWFDKPGRLEYRLRDIRQLMADESLFPAAARKPLYIMEYGIRGYDTCNGKPYIKNLHRYYTADPSCPEIWRTNIAGFQQLWFDIDAAQLGVAGTSKWDAYWAVYDRGSLNQQTYWMTGPASEGYPLTPTYWAASLLFHTVVPGWQIDRVEPWDTSDDGIPQESYHQIGGAASSDTPEQEIAAYAGPSGELTVIGLDNNGRALNGVSADPPSAYSIANLPPNTPFTLAIWNGTGDGTNSIAGTVTTNAAGVARFEVPLQAAFALTTVPVE